MVQGGKVGITWDCGGISRWGVGCHRYVVIYGGGGGSRGPSVIGVSMWRQWYRWVLD